MAVVASMAATTVECGYGNSGGSNDEKWLWKAVVEGGSDAKEGGVSDGGGKRVTILLFVLSLLFVHGYAHNKPAPNAGKPNPAGAAKKPNPAGAAKNPDPLNPNGGPAGAAKKAGAPVAAKKPAPAGAAKKKN
ncbi:uncharacterized protein LOC132277855 [Cornus florida]|uniref:uncharacterized protein LOC132277855 n=1 Tax=Cornus florida TaxID=4283 RepID=UPI002899C4F4|nr:uncharacterized protein LOC132277855 [Cornus florida]